MVEVRKFRTFDLRKYSVGDRALFERKDRGDRGNTKPAGENPVESARLKLIARFDEEDFLVLDRPLSVSKVPRRPFFIPKIVVEAGAAQHRWA